MVSPVEGDVKVPVAKFNSPDFMASAIDWTALEVLIVTSPLDVISVSTVVLTTEADI